MNVAWFKHLKGKEQEDFIKFIKSSAPVLNRLKVLLDKKTKETDVTLVDYYQCPSWSHRQAHTNGYNEAIREVNKLLNIKDDHA